MSEHIEFVKNATLPKVHIIKRKVPAKAGTFLFFFHTKLTFKTKVSQNLERYTKMMYNGANIKNGRRSKYEFNV